MKWIRRIAFVIIALAVASQVPFAYRRYEIRKITDKVAAGEPAHSTYTPAGWQEYRGIIHAHTSLGGHSSGTADEIVTAANEAGLDFVLMTEHYSDKFDTAAMTVNGLAGKTLFIGSNEIDCGEGERMLMIPGAAYARDLKSATTADVIGRLQSEKRLALVTYPERFKSWSTPFDGIEVLSLHTELERTNKVMFAFDMLWSERSYPMISLAQYLRRPDDALAQYDRVSQEKKVVLFGGTDAHSNVGVHLLGDDAGHKYLGLKVDPYRISFGVMQMHLLLPAGQPLDLNHLLAAIKAGHFYTGIEAMGSTSGFNFSAIGGTNGAIMGDEANISPGLMLQTASPQSARIVVLKNGVQIADSTSSELAVKPDGPGVYRVEVYRTELGEPFDKMPWIMSNPIYVR